MLVPRRCCADAKRWLFAGASFTVAVEPANGEIGHLTIFDHAHVDADHRPTSGRHYDAAVQRIAITTADDERIADYVRLTDVNLRRKLETERGLYLAEGDLVLRRAIAAGHVPRSVLVADSRADALDTMALPPGTPIFRVTDALAEAITGFHVHRGVIASMNRPALPELADIVDGARRVVILEDLTNHTNVGAIFRSAAALAADAVLVTPRCADPLYRRSVRVSMGTVFQVPWTRIDPWPRGIGVLRDMGFTVAALALSDDAESLDRVAHDAPDRLALIFGTEMAGLGARTMGAADLHITIPMADGISSLNVAAASAVAMWALRVQS